MERHLPPSYRIIPDNTLLIESVGTKLPVFIAINAVISFFQCYIKRLSGFLDLDNFKIFNHLFRQKTFRQLYIRILFHCSLFICKGKIFILIKQVYYHAPFILITQVYYHAPFYPVLHLNYI